MLEPYLNIPFSNNYYLCRMNNKKEHRGGKRPGAGRKFGSKTAVDKLRPATATISIRAPREDIDALKKKYHKRGEITRLGQEWIKGLLK